MKSMRSTMVVIYSVVGRYMVGSTVTGYHLVGNDGSQLPVAKDRVIYMIGKGLVENLRVQSNGNELIIRGKGVNLNTLPIYDESKQDFRATKASQKASDSAVQPKKDSTTNLMGQFKIIKRIMYKTTCLGYIVVDHSGQERKFSRDQVIKLAVQKLISNATVQRYTNTEKGETNLILRGAGVDLTSLPVVLVDGQGRIIDTSKNASGIKMRATRMKRGGIIHDKVKGQMIPFETGDYLICGVKSILRPVKYYEMESKFKYVDPTETAVCDDYLYNLKDYPIEIYGALPREVDTEQVKRWVVVEAVS